MRLPWLTVAAAAVLWIGWRFHTDVTQPRSPSSKAATRGSGITTMCDAPSWRM
jgi:hypothetical protein